MKKGPGYIKYSLLCSFLVSDTFLYIFIFISQMNISDRFRSPQSLAEYLRKLFTTVRIAQIETRVLSLGTLPVQRFEDSHGVILSTTRPSLKPHGRCSRDEATYGPRISIDAPALTIFRFPSTSSLNPFVTKYSSLSPNLSSSCLRSTDLVLSISASFFLVYIYIFSLKYF